MNSTLLRRFSRRHSYSAVIALRFEIGSQWEI
jgi:hypothetical protein